MILIPFPVRSSHPKLRWIMQPDSETAQHAGSIIWPIIYAVLKFAFWSMNLVLGIGLILVMSGLDKLIPKPDS